MAHAVTLQNSPVVFLMMLTCHVPFNIHSPSKVTARRAQLSFLPPLAVYGPPVVLQQTASTHPLTAGFTNYSLSPAQTLAKEGHY